MAARIVVAVHREGRLEAEHTFKGPSTAGELCEWLGQWYGPGMLRDAEGFSCLSREEIHGGNFFFDCQKKQPEHLFEPGERLNYFRTVYPRIKNVSPSAIAKAASTFIRVEQHGIPVFLNYRPDTAHGLPAALISEIFGRFIDKCSGRTLPDVSRRDCGFICELCEASSTSYTQETLRSDVVIALLKVYLPHYTTENVNNMDIAIYYKGFLLAQIELKNEEGQGGNSYLQSCRYFVHSAFDSKKENAFLGTCFPKLLVDIAGPLMKISAAAFLHAPIIEPLAMSYLVRKSHADHMDYLCRMIVSLRDTLRDLALFYDSPPERVPLSIQRVMLPHPLQLMHSAGVVFETMSIGESYVANLEGYRGRDEMLRSLRARGVMEVFVKFTQRYGSDIHRDWFTRGCAPELFVTVEVAGGWLMVLMEYKRGYADLEDVARRMQFSGDDWTKVCTLAQNCLRRAQESELKGVHGDLRLPNLIVDEECKDVLAVDFGWAGVEGVDRYPYYMNHNHIQWPPGACEGCLLKQEHDWQLLSSQLRRMPTHSYDWKSEPATQQP